MRSGVVAVVDGDGLRERFRSGGATAIVIGGQTRNPSTAELLDAVERTGAAEVVILPNDSAIVPAAEQVGLFTETPVAVVPTRTVLEGLAALSAFDGDSDGSTNREAMAAAAAGVRSGSVTRAVRDAASAHGAIREGDWLALTENAPPAVAGTPLEAAQRVMEVLVKSTEVGDGLDAAAATIVAGADADEGVIAALREWAGDRWPALGFQWFDGGQLLYPYLVGIAVGPPWRG
jgi:dihydroxyacetone kinase-like predicted kinase